MKRKIVPIAIISLILGIVFDWFFFGKAPGVSLFLYSALLLGFTVYLADLFKSRLPLAVYVLLPVILFFGWMTFVRASGMLLFFNIVLIMYLLLLLIRLCVHADKKLSGYTIWQYFQGLPWLPFEFLRESGVELRNALTNRGAKSNQNSFAPVLRGVAMALPVVIIFLLLLSSADLIFQRYVTDVFNFHINGEFIARVIVAVFIASLSVGAYALLFMRPPRNSGPETKNKFSVGSIETSIVLGSVEVLFLLFIIVQAAYFFGGQHHVMTTSFTYAEYARHGFFELITVAAISLLLLWGINRSVNLQSTKQRLTFMWLSVALIAEVLVIMISAHMRLSLYEQAYGFTRSRLLAHLFIYWLAVAFVLAAVYIIRAEQERQFAFRLFMSVLAFFAVLNLINPDALIARHNIGRIESTGKVDALSLSFLSEDATPEITTLLSTHARNPGSNLSAREVIANQLYKQQQALSCQNTGWQSANLARIHAKNLLASKNDQILSNKTKDLNYTCREGQLVQM